MIWQMLREDDIIERVVLFPNHLLPRHEMSPPFRGREAVVPFVTGCHGWRTVGHWHNFNEPSRKGNKFEHMGRQTWRNDIVSWLENWKIATSTVYLLLNIVCDCAAFLFLENLYASLGLCMMPLFGSRHFINMENDLPCRSALWAQVVFTEKTCQWPRRP